jgi:SNF2 family DNA or RNA helicase
MITSEIRPAAYQLVPISKISLNGLNGLLIADGVGLGKTISACLLATYLSEIHKKPTAIVCPPVLVTKWITELKSKFGISAFAVRSQEHLVTARNEMKLRPKNFYVLASSLLSGLPDIELPSLGLVIYDEVHNYRNRETKGYAAAVELSRNSKFRVGLSATPINNSLNDLASEISILLAEDNWEAVAALVTDLWSWNREQITKPFVTRFVKDKLAIHFARRNVRMLEVRYSEWYMQTVNDVLKKLDRDANIYRVITYLRLAASCQKAFLQKFRVRNVDQDDPKLDILRKTLASEQVSHWLVFVEFGATAKYLVRALDGGHVFVITGATPMFERDEIIDSFKQSDAGVLVMTPVGSEGLDLQFCQGVINYDLHWNPMKIEQRVGRIDRIGQSKDQIDVVNVLVADSVDDHVLRIIRKKLDLTNQSIFATAEIVRSRPRESPSGLKQEAIEAELDETSTFLSAIAYSDKMGHEDYHLLQSIDETFCDPGRIRNAALNSDSLPWLNKAPEVRAWCESIKTEGSRLQERLQGYK